MNLVHRDLLGLLRWGPTELPSAVKYFFKYNSCQIDCFFVAIDLYRRLNLNSNTMESSLSRIISNEQKIVQ